MVHKIKCKKVTEEKKSVEKILKIVSKVVFLIGRPLALGRNSVPLSWRVSCISRHVISQSFVIKLQQQLLIIGATGNYDSQLQRLLVGITPGKDSLFELLYNPSCPTPPSRVLFNTAEFPRYFSIFLQSTKKKMMTFSRV